MSINELTNYQKIKLEIERLQFRIKELENKSTSKSIVILESQNSDNTSEIEKRVMKLIYLKDKLKDKLQTLYDEEMKVEQFLEEIEDCEIRVIIRLRFIENQTWEQIGKIVHGERTTPYYKLKRYLEKRGKIR